MNLKLPKILTEVGHGNTESQLIISSKAKNELESIFLDSHKLHSSIILIRGPSGCGKDSLIRFMARKHGFEVRLDRDVENELETMKLVQEEDYYFSIHKLEAKASEAVSYAKIFCEVMSRVSFERMAKKKWLYYIREIPNMINEKERSMVRAVLHKLVERGPLDIVPVIFNLNSGIYE